MAIQAGDSIPECTLKTMGEKGPSNITTDEIFSGKKVLLFAVPVVRLLRRFQQRFFFQVQTQ